MQYGPHEVFQCPKCYNLIKRRSLISANTFNAIIYSDGKIFASMFRTSPVVTKCFYCNTIIWFHKLKPIGLLPLRRKDPSEYVYKFRFQYWREELYLLDTNVNLDNVSYLQSAVPLDIEDYFRILNERLYENRDEELFIRREIWWQYNDRIRDREILDKYGLVKSDFKKNNFKLFADENDEARWKENCLRLISLFNPSDLKQRMLIAELKRNLGEFDECVSILNSINDDKLNWKKEKLLAACEQKNKFVICFE